MTYAEIVAEAKERGARAGRNAGSWVFDGNTTDETKTRAVQGIEDGDPAVLDAIQEPSWLSGEWAGESILELIGDLLDEAREIGEDDADDEIMQAYEDAAHEAFWAEVERSART